MVFVWDDHKCMNFLRFFARSQAIQIETDIEYRKTSACFEYK